MDEPEVGDRFRKKNHGRTITVIDRSDPGTVIYAVGRASHYSIGQEVSLEQWREMIEQYHPLPGKSGSVPEMVAHVQRHPSN
jgi:hypothetical protein